MVYGPGLYNFLVLNRRLVQIFAILSVLAFIQMIIFRSFDSMKGNNSWYTNWSFAGIGLANNLCAKTLIEWDKKDSIELVFQC